MILITGMSGSGKTYTSAKLSRALNIPFFHTDEVYTRLAVIYEVNGETFINPDYWQAIEGIEEIKRSFYPTYPQDSILEGNGVRWDYQMWSDYTMFVLMPSYHKWIEQFNQKRELILEDNEETKRTYEFLVDRFTFEADYYIVDDHLDITQELNPPIMYGNQRPTFMQEKYDSLKIEPKDKTVIDLGGNNGDIIRMCLKNGAKSGLVVDNNWQRLNRANELPKYLFNCEYMEEFPKTCDLLICTAMIHYLKDKEKFIRECAKRCKEFVLECPIDGYRVDAIVPSKEEILSYLGKYFTKVEVVGNSPAPDSSTRLVFHGTC